MSVPKLELQCTSRCRLPAHGNVIAATVSVRDASEEAKAAYMRSTCGNYCQVCDDAGRTAIHMAATSGDNRLVQWLAQHRECNINAKDGENGFTPLHRSVFYGQIHVAVNLIQLGASVTAVDGDELTAVEHAMLDRPPIVELNLNGPCEAYVWGTNANYTLGSGSQHIRQLPELLEAFRKQNISIKQASMHKFHTVFVSHNGTAYSCGHGQGGRLGLGSEQAVITPRPISIATETCVAASVSRDHTVLLMESGSVFTCGLNAHHQLGICPPPPHVMAPTPLPPRVVKTVGTVAGICAARFHTVVWGAKVILTCGLHAGQLGHPKSADKTIIKPKAVTALHLKDSSITKVSSSDGAVVVATDKGQVFLLHGYECRRIASRQTDVAKLVVVGGQLDSRVDKEVLTEQGGSPIKVLLLTASGRLLIWQENLPQFTRCNFTLNRLLLVRDVTMTRSQVLFITRDGEAFSGEIRPRKPRKVSPDQSPKTPASSKQLEKADCEVIKVSKLPHIHRGVSITCDIKGRNFTVIQSHPKQALFDVPQLETTSMRENMKCLLLEANEDDTIHDVIFQIGLRKFPAHQFIISSRNDYLATLIAEEAARSAPGKVVTLKIDHIQPDVFQQVLQYIYTNECDMLTLGSCPVVVDSTMQHTNNHIKDQEEEPANTATENLSAFEVYSAEKKKIKKNKLQSVKKNNTQNDLDPIVIVKKVAKRFNMQDFYTELNGFAYEEGFIVPKGRRQASPQPHWSRHASSQLLNVVIRSETGRELRAHKCILTSRLEYFHSMFCQGWSEAKHTVKLALPFNILEILIDFLYEDSVSPEVRDSEDLDLLSNLLVVADQLFVTRLKEQCEVSLINVLTLKTVAELLQLSDTYLAHQLKRCCMQYISVNLSAVLESRCLEVVTPKLLSELTQYYTELNPEIQKRTFQPYFYAPSVETLNATLEANPFSFDLQDNTLSAENDVKKALKQAKKKPRVHRLSSEGGNAVNRARKESTSSVASDEADQIQPINFDDLIEKSSRQETHKENLDKYGQWVKVPTNKQQKIVQARLRAINASKDPSFIVESTLESFTQLSRNSQSPVPPAMSPSPDPKILAVKSSPQPSIPIPEPPVTAFDFPELCSPPNNANHHKSAPRLAEAKRAVKLSQKQRKRMTLMNDIGLMGDHLETINRSPPAPAWGRQSPESEAGGCSLIDIIRQELKQVRVTPVNEPATQRAKTPEEPRKVIASNPWGKPATHETVSLKRELGTVINFTDIIANEKKEKDNLVKMLAKPLELTQIEDKAISDLLQFYNAAKSPDERITVQRISRGPIATPTWITNH